MNRHEQAVGKKNKARHTLPPPLLKLLDVNIDKCDQFGLVHATLFIETFISGTCTRLSDSDCFENSMLGVESHGGPAYHKFKCKSLSGYTHSRPYIRWILLSINGMPLTYLRN